MTRPRPKQAPAQPLGPLAADRRQFRISCAAAGGLAVGLNLALAWPAEAATAAIGAELNLRPLLAS